MERPVWQRIKGGCWPTAHDDVSSQANNPQGTESSPNRREQTWKCTLPRGAQRGRVAAALGHAWTCSLVGELGPEAPAAARPGLLTRRHCEIIKMLFDESELINRNRFTQQYSLTQTFGECLTPCPC